MGPRVSFGFNKAANVWFKRVIFLCLLTNLFLICSAQNKYKSVNLGGWLVLEGWIKPELFNGLPELLDGVQIQLKSAKLGTYVVAEDGGGKNIAVNRNSPSGWETFRIWRVSETSYQLRVFNKQFIAAQNGGGGIVNAVATIPSTWETFQIIRNPSNPKQVHIKVLNGMYMQANSPDQLTADFQGEPGWDGNNAATFEMNIVESGKLQGDYQLVNGLGPDKARQVMNDHWNTFITESDFTFLAQNGINAVRIPVGWWIKDDPSPPSPFVGGSLNALDNAFKWANNHGIKVIVDLHAALGSQNGEQHSSSRDGYIEWDSQDNIDESLSVIDFLARRYAKDPALLGIELLNEPHSPNVPLDKLSKYYKDGYDIVRKYSSTAYVIMCNRLGENVDPKELFEVSRDLKLTVVDVHWYNLFSSEFNGMSAQQNIDYIYDKRDKDLSSLMSDNGPLIYVGEWTSAWNVNGATKEEQNRFGKAQFDVYGKASFGWGFWTFRNNDKSWSFKSLIENGYLPRPSK